MVSEFKIFQKRNPKTMPPTKEEFSALPLFDFYFIKCYN